MTQPTFPSTLLRLWPPVLGGRSGASAAALLLTAVAAGVMPAAERHPSAPARVASRFAQPATPPVPAASIAEDRLKPIGDIALPGSLPAQRPEPDFAGRRFGDEPREVQGPGAAREWGTSLYAWEAPAFCHRPLYFEDENLERHGQSFGVAQPAVSAAHFFGRAAALPYLAGAYPTHDCVYTLGKGRPGSHHPYSLYRPPVSARGAVYQAGAVTGLTFIVP